MSYESENRTVLRLSDELSKLKNALAKEQSKIANLEKKKASAESAIKKSKNMSTINSKLREIERLSKDIVFSTKTVSDIQTKIGKKDRDLVSAQKRCEKAKRREDEKKLKESEKRFKEVNQTLLAQDSRQKDFQRELLLLKEIPAEIRILFLASNPIDVDRIRLDEEVRAIQEKIRLSDHRDTVKFESRWAVRPSDLFQAINETNPTIIHFSGHGSFDGKLVLQNPDGTAKLITPDAISQAIATVSDNVKLVFFNACYSEVQAKNIVKYIDVAIGMSDSIRDDTACVFAAQFYSSIGFGLSVEQAFNQAKAELMLEGVPGDDIPQLYLKDGVNASDMFLVKKPNKAVMKEIF